MKIRPKKSLSQNFLVSPKISQRIVDLLEIKPDDVVLEIGPGKGALTQFLVEKASLVTAVEIDKNLCQYLKEKFSQCQNLKIVERDFLKINLIEFASAERKIKVIGNLPYQITSPALDLILNQREFVSLCILMLQKEVAQRICAQPKSRDWSALSIGLQLYTNPKLAFLVKKTSFFPQPQVDSAVVKFEFLEKPKLVLKEEKKFFEIVQAAFGQRRKTILNSLCSNLNMEKKELMEYFEKAKIHPQKRAEELGLEDFALLSNLLSI
jgi:16S rRNA (adenine1518-N6/adenine1519-N6)-dimethyltransferase